MNNNNNNRRPNDLLEMLNDLLAISNEIEKINTAKSTEGWARPTDCDDTEAKEPPYRAMGKTVKEMYDEFIFQGFDKEQAFALTEIFTKEFLNKI